MSERFYEYISQHFGFDENEIESLKEAQSKRLRKTLRVNTRKISVRDFMNRMQSKGYEFAKTPYNSAVLDITKWPQDVLLGYTPEHILGYFYLQELSASTAASFLANHTVQEESKLVLDVSASPGGKATQLCELFPNSVVIANDPQKTRFPQLYCNQERMGHTNMAISSLDGRYFDRFPESFDAILLDAPCSGEGTAFRSSDALKYWHKKKIPSFAKLQYKLLEASAHALKLGGDIVYSTCTLNHMENEGVIDRLMKNYGDAFELITLSGEDVSQKRFWPHRDKTGGFFVCKLRKTKSMPIPRDNYEPRSIRFADERFVRMPGAKYTILQNFLDRFSVSIPKDCVYLWDDHVYLFEADVRLLPSKLMIQRLGQPIGKISQSGFVPSHVLGTLIYAKDHVLDLDKSKAQVYFLGQDFENTKKWEDGYYALRFDGFAAGFIKVKGSICKNMLPKKYVGRG